MDVARPRVRRRASGGTVEVPLTTYAGCQEPGELESRVLEAFRAGVSGREQ
jgi:hypothetical protein